MEPREFVSINGKHYREKVTSLIELLAMVDVYNQDDFDKVKLMNAFALEHMQVEVKGIWMDVKAKGKEEYMPVTLAEDAAEMRDIITWYLSTVMTPVFQKSVESMKRRVELAEKK